MPPRIIASAVGKMPTLLANTVQRRCLSTAPLSPPVVPTSLASAQREALEDPEGFWGKVAIGPDHGIPWFREPSATLDASRPPFYRWFPGGEMNTSYACLDHHVQNGRGDTVALVHHSSYYEQPKESFTYRELLGRVERFAGALSEKAGVQKGDRVVIYMPMVPEAIVAMLACARLGAVHSVVFGGFASKELATRIDELAV